MRRALYAIGLGLVIVLGFVIAYELGGRKGVAGAAALQAAAGLEVARRQRKFAQRRLRARVEEERRERARHASEAAQASAEKPNHAQARALLDEAKKW